MSKKKNKNKKYKNKYLDKIGYATSAHEELFYKMTKDKRNKIWKKERETYGGYDSRFTWCANTLLIEEVYTVVKMYLKFSNVDLTFHKFDYRGFEVTQEEGLKFITKRLKYVLKHNESFDKVVMDKCYKKTKEAFEMLGVILPALWW